jgi:hypothetical protein
MTLLSELLDAVVATLDHALVPEEPGVGAPLIAVRPVDDVATLDLGEYMQLITPGVYVSVLGAPELARDTGPMQLDVRLMARCYARLGLVGPLGKPASSRGDVAMDLASAVATVAEDSLWPLEGVPTAARRATTIQIVNRGTSELTKRGVSLWVVTWQQQLELSQRATDTLRAFKRLHLTAHVAAEEPDVIAELELEGGTP